MTGLYRSGLQRCQRDRERVRGAGENVGGENGSRRAQIAVCQWRNDIKARPDARDAYLRDITRWVTVDAEIKVEYPPPSLHLPPTPLPTTTPSARPGLG